MCNVGDIVLIWDYITEDGKRSGGHPFIVVDNQNGQIGGIDFDLVCSTMSSFDDKSEEYKRKKLSYIENLHFGLDDGNTRDGYIKADQMYMFKKSKANYRVLAKADAEFIKELLELIEELKRLKLLKLIVTNIQ